MEILCLNKTTNSWVWKKSAWIGLESHTILGKEKKFCVYVCVELGGTNIKSVNKKGRFFCEELVEWIRMDSHCRVPLNTKDYRLHINGSWLLLLPHLFWGGQKLGRQLGFWVGCWVFELDYLFNSGKRYKQILTLLILKILGVCKVTLSFPQLMFQSNGFFSFGWHG